MNPIKGGRPPNDNMFARIQNFNVLDLNIDENS